ncbi:MAG: hypothetical protein GC168_19670 [Candidatus Hydrogenedens sp.]|nr:hypothetical protein [Candidatus Hydrogenedens sp.]
MQSLLAVGSRISQFLVAAALILLAGGASGEMVDVQLGGPLPETGGVAKFNVSPDGAYALFQSDLDTPGILELYSVASTGGEPVKLNHALQPSASLVSGTTISPDSSHVIYSVRAPATEESGGIPYEFYVVPITGGTPYRFYPGWLDSQYITYSSFSPDSQTIIFTGRHPDSGGLDHFRGGDIDIYTVPVSGGTPTPLGVEMPEGQTTLAGFEITPDGSRLIGVGSDLTGTTYFSLYTVSMTTGAITILVEGEIFGYRLNDDASRIVYLATSDADPPVADLYSIPISAGAPTLLSTERVAGQTIQESFEITGDGARVVYACRAGRGPRTLFSSPIDGGGAVALTPEPSEDFTGVRAYAVRSDGAFVYLVTEAPRELYKVPVTGGADWETIAPIDTGDPPATINAVPGSDEVVFTAHDGTNGYVGALDTVVGGPRVLSVVPNDETNLVPVMLQVSPDGGAVTFGLFPLFGEGLVPWSMHYARIDGSVPGRRLAYLQDDAYFGSEFQYGYSSDHIIYMGKETPETPTMLWASYDPETIPMGEGEGAADYSESAGATLAVFANGDGDGDGSLTLEEYLAGVPGAEFAGFDVLDVNGDGLVTPAELISLIPAGAPVHSADANADMTLDLPELLRVIQLYNASGFGCDPEFEDDGFQLGGTDHSCLRHASDYADPAWHISLGELLRVVQFFNIGGYESCESPEDGFCASARG